MHFKQKTFSIITSAFAVVSFLTVHLPETQASEITKDSIIILTNESRQSLGLPLLESNSLLEKAAHMKANDMLSKGYFAHESPEGDTPWMWIGETQYRYAYAGENLAMDFQTAEGQHRAWMQSPQHRKNILDDRYRDIGVAVVRGQIQGRETTVAVQMFGTTLLMASAQKSGVAFSLAEEAQVPSDANSQLEADPESEHVASAYGHSDEVSGLTEFMYFLLNSEEYYWLPSFLFILFIAIVLVDFSIIVAQVFQWRLWSR